MKPKWLSGFSTAAFPVSDGVNCPSCFSCAAASHPSVPLGLPGVRFSAARQKTLPDAFSSSRRQTDSHQEQILTQVTYLKAFSVKPALLTR